MEMKQRKGVIVEPYERLSRKQLVLIDEVSRELLEDPGLLCYNKEAAELFKGAGAKVEDKGDYQQISVPSGIIDEVLDTAPSKITLGARNPENRIIIDAAEPRVRFGSGAETNLWLEVSFEGGSPKFDVQDGSIRRLCKAAHLADNLENLDFFIRCVNIRDKEVNAENKDVNKFLASLNNITKHVEAGLTKLDALDDIIKIGEIIAGGKDALEKNPLMSFITCVVKSPFQVVEDTATKLIEISKRRMPVVVSSSPMGGATAPFDEFGMVAQINAELLAGIAINQLASPGAPVLYGAVPVRTRLDNLNDMYGAPEFNHYNLDCGQMARYYRLPCYSTAGVGDVDKPGIQSTAEKLLTLVQVPMGGAQYIHYAFGLLDRTNVFCPAQAVMDNAHIGMIKHMLKPSRIEASRRDDVTSLIREVLATDHKTYVYHLPLPTRDPVYVRYPLEKDEQEGGALAAAVEEYKEILEKPADHMEKEVIEELKSKIPGILPDTLADWKE